MRNEFEHEYDNEAEVMIADMEFRPEDTQEDWDAKQRLLAIYNGRLDEREKRREFIKTKGLLNTRMLQVGVMSGGVVCKGVLYHASRTPFVYIFLSFTHIPICFSHMHICFSHTYISFTYTHLTNMRPPPPSPQSLERKRVGVDKDMYAQVRAFTRYSDPVTLHVLAEGLAHEHRLRQRIQELKELRRNGVRTFAQAEDFELRYGGDHITTHWGGVCVGDFIACGVGWCQCVSLVLHVHLLLYEHMLGVYKYTHAQEAQACDG